MSPDEQKIFQLFQILALFTLHDDAKSKWDEVDRYVARQYIQAATKHKVKIDEDTLRQLIMKAYDDNFETVKMLKKFKLLAPKKSKKEEK